MPKRVLIIGILYCLGGALAIWGVVSDLFQSHISINFTVLLLPVGIGLLRGRQRSQWWARFWIILGYIISTLLGLAVLISPNSATATWFGSQISGKAAVPYVLLVTILMAIVLIILHRILYSKKASEYFKVNSEQGAQPDVSGAG